MSDNTAAVCRICDKELGWLYISQVEVICMDCLAAGYEMLKAEIRILHVTAPGAAVPKQSFRVAGHGGYRDPRVTAWQEVVGYYARQVAPAEPWEGDILASLTFYLPDHHRRDLDNLSKAVLDAMSGIIYRDDCQVIDLHIRKIVDRDNPRVEVTVQPTE